MRDPAPPSTARVDAPAPSPGIGLQLYTLRSLGGDFGTLLRHAADAGYRQVETFGPPPADPARAADALAASGVRVCSSHVALSDLEADPEGMCSTNRALGNEVLIVPWLPDELRGDTRAAWEGLGRRLAELGRRCAGHGARLLYHNHDFELAPVDGATGLEWLLGAADAAALGWEPDLGWIVRAGADPEALLARYVGRVPRAHVKDLAAPAESLGEDAPEDGWADVGHGVLDWSRLLPACSDAGVEVLIVEHDAPADPLRSARRSAERLRALL